ncbi:MAG: 3-oxoacyl-ACP synthase III family protein [Myxococcaceae bacterium]|nr:3-oxoacyl-ACP synthase III family protein [Myxococcaceae bacterium]
MEMKSIGILGLAVELPGTKRRNSDWPDTFSREIIARQRSDLTLVLTEEANLDVTTQAISKYSGDPFRGSVERRVLATEEEISDLEARAVKKALEVADTQAGEIDLLIASAAIPDLLGSGNASAVHQKVGLRPDCLTINHDNQCSSALSSMILARSMIASGACRKALIVQSAAYSRVMPYELPLSVNFGDGATAAVLGSVSEGRGVLGSSWFSDGSYHKAICLAPREGGNWYSGHSELIANSLDPARAREAIGRFGAMAKEAVSAAAEDAKVSLEDIKYFACHQPTAWFVELCQRTAGLEHCKTESTFAQTAGVGPCNVMLNLDKGLRSGSLRRGDLVATYAMGSGFTWGAVILRWGR